MYTGATGARRPYRLPAIMLLAVFYCVTSCRRFDSKETNEQEAPWFTNVTVASKIDFQHMSGHRARQHYLPEIMGGGVGLLDFDQDGWLDIYFVQSGSLYTTDGESAGNRLFRNLGNGSFVDVSQNANVADIGYGMGCASGDIDGDGDTDIYVTNVGPNVMYVNNGDGTFTAATKSTGTGDPLWSTSASFLDFDKDGHLDLYVANYVRWSRATEKTCLIHGRPSYCFPKNYPPSPDTLYRNRGDGTFENVTSKAGLHQAFGNGLGVACGDFNDDGWVDVYVANDATNNQLWINQGDGTFVDQALITGCAVNGQGLTEAGMGVQAMDIEHDGDLDLFVTHLRRETNTLYRNHQGDFTDVTDQVGLATPSLPFTGFGLGAIDFDHDGNLDLFVANGRVVWAEPQYDSIDPYAEPNQLFVGESSGTFRENKTFVGKTETTTATSRGAAFGDLDNDGDVDIVVVNRDQRPEILQNNAESRHHWIQFHVLNRQGSLAVGARLQIIAAGRTQRREVGTGYSYCSSNDPRVHFGLAAHSADLTVDVQWPDGSEQTFGPLKVDQQYELRQGSEN